jgi:NAD(P)-dependent dehydrogenase (short-subunit alcohol dehydrogenase family)
MSKGIVVVTGASRGIGAAIAADLHECGFQVAGVSRSGTSNVGTPYACDVTDEAAVRGALTKIAATGQIVGLVNNAGAHADCRSAELSTADYETTMTLNTTSLFVFSREAYPHLVASGGGLIVNIGSFFDKLGVPRNLAYCASKAAVGAITRCLAVEWARDNIQVLNVAPGYIETDLSRDGLAQPKMQDYIRRRVPLRRAGTADEVGKLVGTLFGTSIPYLTGETIYIDGGHGMNY